MAVALTIFVMLTLFFGLHFLASSGENVTLKKRIEDLRDEVESAQKMENHAWEEVEKLTNKNWKLEIELDKVTKEVAGYRLDEILGKEGKA